MPKPRHDNPFAERMIAAHELRGWLSQRERDAMAREAARVAKLAAELRAVPWEDLTPAELAFRFLVRDGATGSGHSREGAYAAWVEATRRGDPRAFASHGAQRSEADEAAEDWRHMTEFEREYANWAKNG